MTFQDECYVIHLRRKVLFQSIVVFPAGPYIDHTAPYQTAFLQWVLRRHKKADLADRLKCLILLRNNGRDGVIRTLDP